MIAGDKRGGHKYTLCEYGHYASIYGHISAWYTPLYHVKPHSMVEWALYVGVVQCVLCSAYVVHYVTLVH